MIGSGIPASADTLITLVDRKEHSKRRRVRFLSAGISLFNSQRRIIQALVKGVF